MTCDLLLTLALAVAAIGFGGLWAWLDAEGWR